MNSSSLRPLAGGSTTPTTPRRDLSTICVYCGSAPGLRESYVLAAREVGGLLAQKGIELVYGGGRAGLMGHVADGSLERGGRVTGIITQQLMDKELGHTGVQSLQIVESMHQRKMAMVRMAKGFIALPGGVGTLDELFEILAWAQLGLHTCPIGVLNVDGFFDPMLELMRHMEREHFLRVRPEDAMVVSADAPELLERMATVPDRLIRSHGQETSR